MRIAVFVGILKEQSHPGIREVLHRHGMDLIDLACGMVIGRDRQCSGSRIALKGMSCFMGQDLHIRAGSIKIREDKGRLKRRKRTAIAAHTLSRSALQIKQFILYHKIKELARLR